jgi:hypothetical protein
VTYTLEIVEGPGAGRRIELGDALILGRDAAADIVLDDGQASRRHARLTPLARGVLVEDLGSTNGTFVNHHELHGRAELSPGDELLVGLTVMQLRSPGMVTAQPSAVRPVPPALAAPQRRPSFVDPVAKGGGPPSSGIPELERLRDRRTKAKATFAPLIIFAIAALAVVIWLGLN